MTFGGTVKKIEGNTYTVEDYEGNQVSLYVGQGTKQIKKKKVGDTLRAEITREGLRKFHSVTPIQSAYTLHGHAVMNGP